MQQADIRGSLSTATPQGRVLGLASRRTRLEFGNAELMACGAVNQLPSLSLCHPSLRNDHYGSRTAAKFEDVRCVTLRFERGRVGWQAALGVHATRWCEKGEIWKALLALTGCTSRLL